MSNQLTRAQTKKLKVIFKCHEVICNKTAAFSQNHYNHESKFNNMPVKRRSSTLLPLYNANSKIYHCPKNG